MRVSAIFNFPRKREEQRANWSKKALISTLTPFSPESYLHHVTAPPQPPLKSTPTDCLPMGVSALIDFVLD
jgi:hypothetical protein